MALICDDDLDVGCLHDKGNVLAFAGRVHAQASLGGYTLVAADG